MPGPHETRFFSLRLRLLGLVLLVLLPWLALIAYTQADERKEAIANVNRDAMRLIQIIASNRAAQAYPVTDAAGELQAVAIAAQGLSWLTAVLANVEFPHGGVLVVVDRNGTVLARMPDTGESIGKPLADQHVLAMLSAQRNNGVFEADDAQGVARLWAQAPVIAGQGLHAAIGVPKSVAFEDINRRLSRNLAALAVVTILALAAAWYGSKRLLRQVDALVAATEKLGAGDLGARASLVGGRSELRMLAGAFNTMAATLETRDRELRIAEEKTRAVEIELAVTHANMEIAKQIQRSLLPEDPLSLAGVQVAGRCIPAAEVGGDHYGGPKRHR